MEEGGEDASPLMTARMTTLFHYHLRLVKTSATRGWFATEFPEGERYTEVSVRLPFMGGETRKMVVATARFPELQVVIVSDRIGGVVILDSEGAGDVVG